MDKDFQELQDINQEGKIQAAMAQHERDKENKEK